MAARRATKQAVEPGRVLADRYEILAIIATGAMSTVWAARDSETREEVAIKAVSLEEAGWRAEVRDRFTREARMLSLLRHTHLVGVRDIGETDDGFLFLVLEKLTGETLADRLGHPPRLTWRQATALGLEIADGLAALHAHGIIHRDLKPANIILHSPLGGPPVSKLIDLGISKAAAAAADPELFATLTATGQVLGTPAYMSYEQAVGTRDVDARTDVWALGVILFEMLSGRRPFDGSNVNAVLAAIRNSVGTKLRAELPGVPSPLLRVVERCLTRSREARYADGGELHAALTDAAALAERMDAGRRRARWVTIAATCCLLPASTTAVASALKRDRTLPAITSTAATAAPAASEKPPGARAVETSMPSTPPPTPSAGERAVPASAPTPSAARPQSRSLPPPKPPKSVTQVNNSGL